MALQDLVRAQTSGLVSRKLSGTSRQALDLLDTALRRSNNIPTPERRTSNFGRIDPLAAAMSRPDPLLNIDWYCRLPFLSGVQSFPNELSWDRVEEATIPMLEFEPISNYRAGKMYHYPAHHSVGSLSLKFYEDVTGVATAYIRNWQSLILDRSTGLMNHPVDFKFPISFTIFDVAKLDVMVITYLGCWPQRPDSYQLVSGQSDRVNPTVEFNVDDVTVSFAKFAAEQIPSLLDNVGKEFPPARSNFTSVFPTGDLGLPG